MNNEGFISRDELLKPDGLLDYLLKTLKRQKSGFELSKLDATEEMVQYWTNHLDIGLEELIRALVKTFNLGAELSLYGPWRKACGPYGRRPR